MDMQACPLGSLLAGIKYAVVHLLADRFHSLFHKLPETDTIFEAQPVKEHSLSAPESKIESQ